MIETKIPKDIRSYKTKVVGSLTIRQVIFFIIAVVVDLIVWFLFLTSTNLDLRARIMILLFIDLPILAFCFEIEGLPLEQYLKEVILGNFIAPAKRKAQTQLFKENKKPERTSKQKKALQLKYKQYPEFKPYK